MKSFLISRFKVLEILFVSFNTDVLPLYQIDGQVAVNFVNIL